MIPLHPLILNYIRIHKSIASELGTREIFNQKNEREFLLYKKMGLDIVFELSKGKCAGKRCDETKNLTFHHVITRQNKAVLPIVRYRVQRHYFGNIFLLCWKCHCTIHKFPLDKEKVDGYIDVEKWSKKLDSEKKKYERTHTPGGIRIAK